jgi:malate dehydrogenase (oxaloacetate-decarboxylating)
MFMTAARALAELSPVETDKNGSLLPPLKDSRRLSRVIAAAVAREAIAEGLSDLNDGEVEDAVGENVWEPRYVRYEREG